MGDLYGPKLGMSLLLQHDHAGHAVGTTGGDITIKFLRVRYDTEYAPKVVVGMGMDVWIKIVNGLGAPHSSGDLASRG